MRGVMTTRRVFRVWVATILGGLVFSSCLATAGRAASGLDDFQMAPLNPEFVEWQATQPPLEVTASGHYLGYVPPPTLWPSQASTTVSIAGVRLQSFPSRYDSREHGLLTPVKNQGQCGSCWAFATYGALEAGLMPSLTLDYSENNLKNLSGFDWECCKGGNYNMSMAYLAAWKGPVAETDDPYAMGCSSLEGLPVVRHVQDVITLPGRQTFLGNDTIKQAVMDYGVVATNMRWEDGSYSTGGNSYYYSGTSSTNHAVCIVGWDDSFPASRFSRRPAGDGAFLIRNSWGTDWGNEGYFWASYYDTLVGTTLVVFPGPEPKDNYQKVYQYDPLGLVSCVGPKTSYTAYAANVFRADSAGYVRAFSTYAMVPGTQYKVWVYVNPSDGPVGGASAATATGTWATAGYHTVPLEAAIPVKMNDKFSVVVMYTTPSFGYPLPVEYPVANYCSRAKANAGEGYLSLNGSQWADLTQLTANASFCIKAFCSADPPQPVQTPQFSPAAGTYRSAQAVRITSATPDATIRYTTDGTDPVETSTKFSAPITVSKDTTIKARAWKSGWLASSVSSASYVITGRVEQPAFSPDGGTFGQSQTVTMSCATPGAAIRYTTDGSAPSASSALYGSPVKVDGNTTLKAVAYKTDWDPSLEKSATYTFNVGTISVSPAGDEYTEPQNVTLTCPTEGAVIHYTTGGQEPTTTDTAYSGAIRVDHDLTLKAKAFKANWNAGPAASATYQITGRTLTPVMTPAGGSFNQPQTVTLTCRTPQAQIRYTTDGTAPTESATLYSGAIQVQCAETLKARAFHASWPASEVKAGQFNLQPVAPVFSPSGGSYSDEQTVTIATPTAGAEVRYTTDGSDPDTDDPVASGPITVDKTATVKARAWVGCWAPSEISSAKYDLVVAPPTLDPPAGSYDNPVQVAAQCATPDAVVRYTTDGREPDEAVDPVVDGPIPVNASATLRFRAFREGWTPSQTVTAPYFITAAAPVISPNGGLYDHQVDAVITCSTAGSAVHYTTNGQSPTLADPLVSGPVPVTASCVLSARAFCAGRDPSAVSTARFTLQAQAPVLSPGAMQSETPVRVTMTCPTPGVTIRYTMDGSEPTAASTILAQDGSVLVSEPLTLKARAFKAGLEPSTVTSAHYSICVAAPEFTPPAGTYTDAQNIALTCATASTVVHYTNDGSEPTEASPSVPAGGSVFIGEPVTLKAKAYKSGRAASEVAVAEYDFRVITPKFSRKSDSYNADIIVTVTCPTPYSEIHYTTDGSEPTRTSTKIASGNTLHIEKNLTLKAKAWRAGWHESETAAEVYEITGKVATPEITPKPGSFSTAVDAHVTCATEQSVIRYTLDGTEPTEESPVVAGGTVHIAQSCTLKAKAYRAGWAESNTSAAQYEITGQAATPAFSPAAGAYTRSVQVRISSETPGALVCYTTNGQEPTESDPGFVGSGTVTVDQTCTLKARAWKQGWLPSETRSGQYTITGRLAAPVFSPMGGTYTAAQTVTLTCEADGAVIHYTTDGTTPIETSPQIASGASVQVDQTMTLAARAFKDGWEPSLVVQQTYVITNTVAHPVLNPAGGAFTAPQNVTATCATEGAVLHYTQDGREPAESDPSLSAGAFVRVDHSCTLKVKAFLAPFDASETASAEFTITGKVQTPEFAPPGGSYTSAQQVRITCGTEGATIRYTTDGREPTESSAQLPAEGFVTVRADTTLKARAWKDGWTASDTAAAVYRVSGTAATPRFSPAGGTYDSARDVKVTCETADALIYVTTNGNEPTPADRQVSSGGTVRVERSLTLKAKAWRTGWEPSETATAEYVITGRVQAPVLDPPKGSFREKRTIHVSCTTEGAVIRYTLDGSEPSETSPMATSEITVERSVTLKVKAWKDGWASSLTTEGVYALDSTAPKVQILSPTANEACSTNASVICVEGSASDNTAVTAVVWKCSTGQTGTCTGSGQWTAQSVSLQPGENQVEVTASDAAGNTATDRLVVRYVPDITPGDAWQGMCMVSVPIQPFVADPKEAVAFSNGHWAIYQTSVNRYLSYGADTEHKTWFVPAAGTPGRGFWAELGPNHTTPTGIIPAQDQPVMVHLARGWNMVGQPFVSALKWDSSRILVQQSGLPAVPLSAASGVVLNLAYGWNTTTQAYYVVTDKAGVSGAQGYLQPWQAYWFVAGVDCDLILPPPSTVAQ